MRNLVNLVVFEAATPFTAAMVGAVGCARASLVTLGEVSMLGMSLSMVKPFTVTLVRSL